MPTGSKEELAMKKMPPTIVASFSQALDASAILGQTASSMRVVKRLSWCVQVDSGASWCGKVRFKVQAMLSLSYARYRFSCNGHRSDVVGTIFFLSLTSREMDD
jgi:hypothetical protein